jgi:DNA modification methylase
MAVSNLEIVYRDPRTLKAYARNTRTHTDEQVELIRSAIARVGFTNPILLKEDGETIGAGHARQRAAIMEGLSKVPTITLHGLTEEEWRANVIMDNRLAEAGSGWSIPMLTQEIGDLKADGFDVALLGFDADFLNGLFPVENAGEGDADSAPGITENPVPVLGDVWLLGNHRLVCGDSTTVEAVDKALAGVKPLLMVTDPPYGVKLDPSKRAKGMDDGSTRAVGKIMNDDRADWREAWALFPGDVAYVWHADKTSYEVEESLRVAGFDKRAQIIWKKGRPVQSVGNISKHSMGYNSQHEACFYVVRKGSKVDWKGDRSQSTVWDIDHTKSDTGHGSQKPVEAMERPIRNNSSPGQAVYEPFSGSGTTIIACEKSGRVCHAIELDPAYVEVAILRWQTFAGQGAVLEATGQTFTEVMGDRVPGKVIVAGKARKE